MTGVVQYRVVPGEHGGVIEYTINGDSGSVGRFTCGYGLGIDPDAIVRMGLSESRWRRCVEWPFERQA